MMQILSTHPSGTLIKVTRTTPKGTISRYIVCSTTPNDDSPQTQPEDLICTKITMHTRRK